MFGFGARLDEGPPTMEVATVTGPLEALPPSQQKGRHHPLTKLVPSAKLTRAHVELLRRPAVIEEANAALLAVAADLTSQLGVSVTLEARLLEATLHTFTHVARNVVYLVVELNNRTRGLLELDAAASALLLQHAAGTSEGGVAPSRLTRIEEAALGWLALTALSAARTRPGFHQRYGPRLLGLFIERAHVLELLDSRLRHLSIEVSLLVAGKSGLARLLVPADFVRAVIDPVAPSYPAELAPEVAVANLVADCRLGVAGLAQTEALSLAVRDVIVFAGVRANGGALTGTGRLLTAGFELRGSFDATGFTLTGAAPRANSQERPMSDAVDPDLPVELEIELTRVKLSISQLGTLRTGGVIPLHLSGSTPVTLRLGDKAIAKAELVDVEGDIGARITALL